MHVIPPPHPLRALDGAGHIWSFKSTSSTASYPPLRSLGGAGHSWTMLLVNNDD